MQHSLAVVIAIALLGTSWQGCKQAHPAVAAQDPGLHQDLRLHIDSLYQDYYSGLTSPTEVVVRSTSDWNLWWKRIVADYVNEKPSIPPIDFSTSMAILVASGQQSSTGFSLSIDSVTVARDDLNVYTTDRGPGGGCLVGTTSTQPVLAVRVQRRPEPPHFVLRKIRNDCRS